MSTYVNTLLPKLCHARVGQKVRLPHTQTGVIQPEIFVVAALEEAGRRPAREGMSQGLYDDERELSLVSVSTGLARRMPHLSSRVELLPMDPQDAVQADLPPAVVLVSEPEPTGSVVQVGIAARRGMQCVLAVNLADVDDVRALLDRLQRTESRVLSVVPHSGPSEAELKTQWRQAVAKEETLLSFDEYKQALA